MPINIFLEPLLLLLTQTFTLRKICKNNGFSLTRKNMKDIAIAEAYLGPYRHSLAGSLIIPFNCQPHEMVKHTQTIHGVDA